MPRFRINYSKQGPAGYISHLDLARTLERSFRRARLPIAYSEGFNPHPRFSFAPPLPVGMEGLKEVLDVELTEQVDCRELAERLNSTLPEGLAVVQVQEILQNTLKLSTISAAGYLVSIPKNSLSVSKLNEALTGFMAQLTIEIISKSKGGKQKTKDIRPGIMEMEQLNQEENLTYRLVLKTGSALNVRPEDVMEAFFQYADEYAHKTDWLIIRTEMF